jgi:hypothetical protein
MSEEIEPKAGDRWRHYTGNSYDVLHVATDAQSSLKVVIYQGTCGGTVWCRPLSDWLATVMNAEHPVPVKRFTLEVSS